MRILVSEQSRPIQALVAQAGRYSNRLKELESLVRGERGALGSSSNRGRTYQQVDPDYDGPEAEYHVADLAARALN